MKKITLIILLLQTCLVIICNAQVYTTQISTSQSGGNGSNGVTDYSIIAKPASGQAVIGAEVTGDSWSNMILGSNVSGTRRFWSFSKRTSAETHDLQLLYYNGTAFSNPRLTFATSGHVGVNVASPQVKLDLGNTQGNGLQFRYDESTNYRIGLTPYWNSSTDTRLDFNVERIANSGFTTVMSVGYGNNVGIGTIAPAFKLDVEGGTRIKNSSTTSGSYTTFRVQGPDYAHGLEIDFFGNNNIPSDPNWSYGGGAGSCAIMNVNPKPLVFGTNNQGKMLIDANGNVGIGTTTPGSFKLAVEGKIGASEVVVTLARPWPDYVFENDYKLPSLSELEQYIKTNKHLPDVPTASDVQENGLSVGEMNAVLLKKVEELTLHLIEMKKENEEISQLKKRIEILERVIDVKTIKH